MVAVGERIVLAKMPGYLAAFDAATSDSGSITSEAVIQSVTFDQISGVAYLIQCEVTLRSSGATAVVTARMRQDSLTGTLMDGADDELSNITGGNRPQVIPLRARYVAGSTGSKTIVITAERRSGSGDVVMDVLSTNPQLLTVTVAG